MSRRQHYSPINNTIVYFEFGISDNMIHDVLSANNIDKLKATIYSPFIGNESKKLVKVVLTDSVEEIKIPDHCWAWLSKYSEN